MDGINTFKRSYALLQRFCGAWLPSIEERCKSDQQRQAAFYLWARYSMSMGTLDALYAPHFVPDVSLICRACLEFDVSLESVTKDKNVARDYLEFDKHAKANYLKMRRKQGDIDRLLALKEQFVQTFGEEPDDLGRSRNSWCATHGGITGLMEKFGRKEDRCLYNLLSQFAWLHLGNANPGRLHP